MTKAAAVCSLVLGLGFGLPGAYGTWYYARQGEVWTFLGFPTYGNVLRFLPPLVMPEHLLEEAFDVVAEAVSSLT